MIPITANYNEGHVYILADTKKFSTTENYCSRCVSVYFMEMRYAPKLMFGSGLVEEEKTGNEMKQLSLSLSLFISWVRITRK